MATENYSIGLEYDVHVDEEYCTVTGIGTCTDTEIVIPETYEGYDVRRIGQEAFRGYTNLTSITIPDSVTSIGQEAFSECSSLTSITTGNSVTSIGSYAFNNTAYYKNESNWENGVLYIGKYLIAAKTDISGAYTIKEGTKLIVDSAFRDCSNLTSITIPNSVTEIGTNVFLQCSSLTSVTIPNSATSIGDGAFGYCDSLTSITIPNSVTSIGKSAFWSCTSLTSITIPNSVTSIGNRAFYSCTQLQKITLDHPVNSVEGAPWGAPENVQIAWIGVTGSENVEFYFLNDPNAPCPYQGAISFGVQAITDSDDNAVSVGDDGILYVTDATGPHAVGTFDAAKIRFSRALAFTENFGKYKPNGVRTTYEETKGMSVQQFITSALTNYSIKSYPRLTASISPSSARYGTTQDYNLTLTFTQGQYSTGLTSTCEIESIAIEGRNKLPASYKKYISELNSTGSTTIPLASVQLLDNLSYTCTVTHTTDKTGGVGGVCISGSTATDTTTISCYDGWIICPTTNTYTKDNIEGIIREAIRKTENDNQVDSYNISTSWKNLYVLVPTSTGIRNWNPIDATNNSPLGNLFSDLVNVNGGNNYDVASEQIEYTFFSVSNATEYNACTINFNWS